MSTDTNKAISRRFLMELFSQGKMAAADEMIAADHINRGPGALPGLPRGPERSKQLVMVYPTAFPDSQFTIDEQIAEGRRRG